jgi:sulfur-carrier protein
MMTITIQYFALLREERGLASERLRVEEKTPQELYERLREEHRFRLRADQVRFAVNGEFAEPDSELNDGDEVVFIPPVAGG